MAKGMMGAFLNDIKIGMKLRVGGEIQKAKVWKQEGKDIASFAMDGKTMLAGMDKLMADEAGFAKKRGSGTTRIVVRFPFS